jgi:hypothetical protein
MSQPRLEEGGAGGTGLISHRSPKLLPIAHGQRLKVVVAQPQPQSYIHSQCGQDRSVCGYSDEQWTGTNGQRVRASMRILKARAISYHLSRLSLIAALAETIISFSWSCNSVTVTPVSVMGS